MLVKSYYAFFKGNDRLAKKGLKRLDEWGVQLKDVRYIYQRTKTPGGFSYGKMFVVWARVKGNIRDAEFMIVEEEL